MLKLVHVFLACSMAIGFISRVLLSQLNPRLLAHKWLRISPHILDTAVLLTGIGLVLRGSWWLHDYKWLIAKLFALCAYIGFGALAMRSKTMLRWVSFF